MTLQKIMLQIVRNNLQWVDVGTNGEGKLLISIHLMFTSQYS